MAIAALVSIEEYLQADFEHDMDYVDGVLEERDLGEEEHSDLQTRFIKLLLTVENERYIRANTEFRMQVKASRFRVPDVCVRRRNSPSERILRHAPLLCIEVLSASDRPGKLKVKVQDYLEMGVPAVWVLDFEKRNVTIYTGETAVTLTEGTLTVPETPVVLGIGDVFGVLDEYER